jgi:O-antigen/teichoic acid export membrane protein
LNIGVIRYISYYLSKKNPQRVKGTIIGSIKISLVISIVLATAIFLLSEKISIGIFHEPDLIFVLRVFALILPFISLHRILSEIFIGFKKAHLKAIFNEILPKALQLALTLLLIYLGYKLIGVVIAQAIAIVLAFFVSIYYLNKKVFSFIKTKIKSITFTKKLLIYCWPLLMMGILSRIIAWTDVLMLGHFKTSSEVGIYNVALPTATLILMIPIALGSLFLPIITELHSKNKKDELKKLYIRTSKIIFLISWPITLLMIIFSKQILSIHKR